MLRDADESSLLIACCLGRCKSLLWRLLVARHILSFAHWLLLVRRLFKLEVSRHLAELIGSKLLFQTNELRVGPLIWFKQIEDYPTQAAYVFLGIEGTLLQLFRPGIFNFHDFLCQIQSWKSKVTWLNMDWAIVKQGNLNHIFRKIGCHLISVWNLDKSLEKVLGADKVNVKVEMSQHWKLHLNYLFFSVRVVRNVDVIFYQWRPYLLVFAGNQHCRNTNKL